MNVVNAQVGINVVKIVLCALSIVVLYYSTKSSSESLDQFKTLDKLTQHELQLLCLMKSRNGIGLILPDILQDNSRHYELLYYSSCCHIQFCIGDSSYELKDNDIFIVYEKHDNKSILDHTPMLSPGYIIFSPNHSLHSIPSNICYHPYICRVNLQYNEIKHIDQILDTFILHHNLVEKFSKETFLNMTWICEIDLSHNRLTYIEYRFLNNVNGIYFDVFYTYLTSAVYYGCLYLLPLMLQTHCGHK